MMTAAEHNETRSPMTLPIFASAREQALSGNPVLSALMGGANTESADTRSVLYRLLDSTGLELECPLEPRLNLAVEVVNARTVAWAQQLGLVTTEKQVRRLMGSKVGWLVARAFPSVQQAALQVAADWTTLFCLLDDYIERFDSPAQVEVLLSSLLNTFRGDLPSEATDAYTSAFADLRTRLLALGSPQLVARFADQLEELFGCFVTEAHHRARNMVPRLLTYMWMRQVTVGLYVEFELFGLTDGMVLPEQVREHPVLCNLMARASNLVGWANDIFTYEREVLEGEVHNLVMVLLSEHQLTLQETARLAVQLHNAEMKAFLAQAQELPSFGPELDAQVQRFVDMLKCWVRGHLDWARETGRYLPPQPAAQADA